MIIVLSIAINQKSMAEPVQNQIEPKYRKNWTLGLGILVLILIVFGFGMFIGNHHRYGFGGHGIMMSSDRYWAYGPKPGYMMMGGFGVNMRGTTVGNIGKISGNVITVNSSNGVSQNVLVTGSTQITKNNANIKISDLKPNDQVTVYGVLDSQNQIEASLIAVQ